MKGGSIKKGKKVEKSETREELLRLAGTVVHREMKCGKANVVVNTLHDKTEVVVWCGGASVRVLCDADGLHVCERKAGG